MIIINFKKTNELIDKFEKSIDNPQIDKSKKLYTGIDLGTAFIVLAVLDEDKNPVCGAYEFANVIKDGMVVDYIGACDIVKKLKKEIEDKIGVELFDAGVAIPPNTESIDGGVVKNVAEAAGFNVVDVFDEPTAANMILELKDGAVVDIGGGTTGISILKNGKVIKVVDEATGGTHFSLVLSGANKISFEDAETLKRDFKKHKEIFPMLKPVIDKIISIINSAISGTDVDEIILVGGSALLENIEKYIEDNIKIKTLKPKNPMFVTPLGIAMGIAKKGE